MFTMRDHIRKEPTSMLTAHWKLLKRQHWGCGRGRFQQQEALSPAKTDLLWLGQELQLSPCKKRRPDTRIKAQGELIKLY